MKRLITIFNFKQKGFTLVEILVVMIIIGILSGMLVLVVEAGQDKAKATRIVMNLKSAKTAATFAYSKYNIWPSEGDVSSLDSFFDRSLSATGAYDIKVVNSGDKTTHYVGYKNDSELTKGVTNKLEIMREKADVPLRTSTGGIYTAGDKYPYMKLN